MPIALLPPKTIKHDWARRAGYYIERIGMHHWAMRKKRPIEYVLVSAVPLSACLAYWSYTMGYPGLAIWDWKETSVERSWLPWVTTSSAVCRYTGKCKRVVSRERRMRVHHANFPKRRLKRSPLHWIRVEISLLQIFLLLPIPLSLLLHPTYIQTKYSSKRLPESLPSLCSWFVLNCNNYKL